MVRSLWVRGFRFGILTLFQTNKECRFPLFSTMSSSKSKIFSQFTDGRVRWKALKLALRKSHRLSCCSAYCRTPFKAILVIFGRRALFFYLKVLEKMKKWHHFCAHVQWWSPWRRKNVEKGHLTPSNLRGAWRDREPNDIFGHCSLLFYFLDFKFSNFVCPSERHPLIWLFFKKFLQEKENYPKNHPKRLSSLHLHSFVNRAETWYTASI